MDGNPCRAFFESRVPNTDWVKELQQQPNRVAWEKLSASRFSLGVVSDGERVYRIAFNPLYWDLEAGLLKPTFFDDATSRGASTQRLRFISKRAVWRKAVSMAATFNATRGKEERSVARLAPLDVAKLRAMNYQQQRAVCVYDTAMEDDRAHADICVVVAGRQASRSIRASLFELAKVSKPWRPLEIQAVEHFRALVSRMLQKLKRNRP
jgi:hypothetical protein